MMNQARLAILASLLLVSACATVEVGREFDLKAFDARVRRGATTQAEVRSWLGAPAGVGASVESTGERYEQWTYYHGEGRWPGLKGADFKMLQIKFDERGVVRAYNWSGEAQ
jgi:hypothetical protein